MLLPSLELQALHERVPICLSGNELPGNCDVRYGQFYYFFMFNAEGELTTVADMSNGLTSRVRKGMTLPAAFLDMVDESLQITESLDDCEREYLDSGGSDKAYRRLLAKLSEMERIGSMRVVKRLRDHAEQMNDPVRTRYHALSIEVSAVDKQVINKGAIDSLALSIQSFLGENPGHPAAAELIDGYLKVALRYTFDIASHCRKVAADWQQNASTRQKRAADRNGQLLTERCDKELVLVRAKIRKLKSDSSYDAPRLYAQLGNASKTLDVLGKVQTFGVFRPIHKAWREAAEVKLK